jgi:lysyl-tRNA synthetase class 2
VIFRTYSPSQLGKGGPRGTLRIAGRLVGQAGPRVTLADALGAVEIVLELKAETPAPLEKLAWVVVEARSVGRKWWGGKVVEHRPSAAAHDFERVAGMGVGNALRARALAGTTLRRYFDERGFIEVATPSLVPAPGTEVQIEPIPAGTGYLVPSPELQMKRLLAGGMPRIYQLGHAFRAAEQGSLHEAEFTMLEWYRAHEGYSAVMVDTEQIVARTLKALHGSLRLDLGERTIDCKPPFDRITVREAFERYANIPDASALAAADEDRYFEILVGTVEPILAQNRKPIFLVDYPLSQAALARPCPDAPGYAERFELYLAGVELCNGYGELTDPDEQHARFVADNARRRQRGQRELPIDDKFLAALRAGLPPCAGNALGFDRLIMLALGQTRLDRVMAFPKGEL